MARDGPEDPPDTDVGHAKSDPRGTQDGDVEVQQLWAKEERNDRDGNRIQVNPEH